MKRKNSKRNTLDPLPFRATLSPETTKGGDSKTSEYAFFKKLKRDAFAVHKEGNQSIKDIVNSEKGNIGGVSSFHSFKSPNSFHKEASAENNFEKLSATFRDMHSLEKSKEKYSNATRPAGGTRYKHDDIFSRKRQKLRQWVAETSFPEIDEFCWKGFDIVSMLLNRLLPESNEDNVCPFRTPKSGQVERNVKTKLLSSPESDIYFKKSHQLPTGNLVGFEYELQDFPWLDRRDRFLSESNPTICQDLNTRILSNSDPTACHDLNTIQYYITEPDSELGGGATISCNESNSACGFSLKKHGHLPQSFFEELNDYNDRDRCLPRRKPQMLQLGWDSENMTEDRDLSISWQNTELITYPTMLASWGSDHFPSLDNDFQAYTANELSESFDFSNCTLNFESFLPSPSASYLKPVRDFGKHGIEDKDDVVADWNQLPVTLPRTSSYLNLAGKCGSSFLSPQNHHRLMNKGFKEVHYHPSTKSPFFTVLDFELGRKCLPMSHYSKELYSSTYLAPQFPQDKGISSHLHNEDDFESYLYDSNCRGTFNHFREDIFNFCDWSSYYFQLSLCKEKACPLLLDKQWPEGSEGEIYCADEELRYI
ncbi:hypothetical protein CFOL_v3_07374 [Cephalotus follicularis]|uniref:Uncharacterized protein n=1 Tax=Cephalotus follicularis TaxID=3775 RepID=A0A1Q3B741_CEPFO|nr:hypothetical protein CFOL_v3_07374 [Cephalotus follicularis]